MSYARYDCKLKGINPDTEPPSHFMSGKTWTSKDGLGVGAKASILPLGYEYCDKSSDTFGKNYKTSSALLKISLSIAQL